MRAQPAPRENLVRQNVLVIRAHARLVQPFVPADLRNQRDGPGFRDAVLQVKILAGLQRFVVQTDGVEHRSPNHRRRGSEILRQQQFGAHVGVQHDDVGPGLLRFEQRGQERTRLEVADDVEPVVVEVAVIREDQLRLLMLHKRVDFRRDSMRSHQVVRVDEVQQFACGAGDAVVAGLRTPAAVWLPGVLHARRVGGDARRGIVRRSIVNDGVCLRED